MWRTEVILLAFVGFYPVVTAALWMAGGTLFRLCEERGDEQEPNGGWPGVTVLIPAYNEAGVIATAVRAARMVDYPLLEILVLDDGSTDDTDVAARAASEDDPRVRVIRDAQNRGKAERLNIGLGTATYDLVTIVDADAHIHPQALKRLATRISRHPIIAAVAGAPHVTNRGKVIQALQVLEAASIIGLIRRTQSLTGRVGVVAGVLGMFRRDRVLAVGGYDPRMATEDIDLTWRLLLAGWHTDYEPDALVGMQVPSTLRALWAQRTRWARGQGEVLHTHLRETLRLRNRRMWLVAGESVASLAWVVGLAASFVLAGIATVTGVANSVFAWGIAWGISIAVVAMLQLTLALVLEHRYDPTNPRAFLIGPLYPLGFWAISGAAALRSQAVALIRGPRGDRVVWDIPREAVNAPQQKTPPPGR